MLAKVMSYGLSGLLGQPITVETDVSNGLPAYETVGLPDAAVRESKERVRAAIRNSGLEFPVSRITVNLAPADMKKEGSLYDLAIAVGLLSATGQVPIPDEYLLVGELALDGSVRAVTGILPMMINACSQGFKKAIVPAHNAPEASYIADMEIIAVSSLTEAVNFLKDKSKVSPYPKREWENSEVQYSCDFADIRGQQGAKRAAEVAVAGGHNILLVGTPGSGKTMLARCLPSILPELTFEEALEITKIHSVNGTLKCEEGIVKERPFRAPHHGASAAALIGGGQKANPGEISLAHYGVLFLDELPEFKRDVLESLRQPLEDGMVTITRASFKATYPSRFMLVAAMNPCPCGNFGSRTAACRCTPNEVSRYRNRISGPLLDRIDMHIEMTEVGYTDITSAAVSESSKDIRKRVNAARKKQRDRFVNEGILFNAQMNNSLIEKYCVPDERGKELLKRAYSTLKLTTRAYYRVLKVSRTIADLEGSKDINCAHISEAVQYRSADDKYWSR